MPMMNGHLPTRESSRNERANQAIARGDFRIDGVDRLVFALDRSCNLSCPSCRTHRIADKASESVEKVRAVKEKLLPLLPGLRLLHINPAGELFASRPSRMLLELINDENCPDLIIDIMSNGTLFNEKEWMKFPGIHDKVRSVRISIDAARKETFEKLRRPAKYEAFIENIRFLAGLRASGRIKVLLFSFTYQIDNFREMRDFVTFGESMNADYVQFERLQNLAFTQEDYEQKAVHHSHHPFHGDFIAEISDPIFRSECVYHDFNSDGLICACANNPAAIDILSMRA
jgi:MoaA/NifB/PqqE/SkfB family radical SAM enzyme